MKPQLSLLVSLVIGVALFAAIRAYATKPCPESPFLNAKHEFERDKCVQGSAWIAIGKITNVVHHPAGMPLNKDFAEFTLRIERWEKGEVKDVQEIKFTVGWCNNRQEVPQDASGLFRFYGPAMPAKADDKPVNAEYYYFERVEEGK